MPPLAQPGGTFLACSAALSGSTLAAVQTSGGYVSSYGLPPSTSYTSSKVVCASGITLPYGTGGNAIGLTYNGQLIDTVRRAARAPQSCSIGAPLALPLSRAHICPRAAGRRLATAGP